MKSQNIEIDINEQKKKLSELVKDKRDKGKKIIDSLKYK